MWRQIYLPVSRGLWKLQCGSWVTCGQAVLRVPSTGPVVAQTAWSQGSQGSQVEPLLLLMSPHTTGSSGPSVDSVPEMTIPVPESSWGPLEA